MFSRGPFIRVYVHPWQRHFLTGLPSTSSLFSHLEMLSSIFLEILKKLKAWEVDCRNYKAQECENTEEI